MKKRFFVSIIFILISFCFILNVDALSYGRVTNSSSTTRTGAGTSYSKSTVLSYNDDILLLNTSPIKSASGCSSGWYKANINGIIRYVCSSDISTSNTTVRVKNSTSIRNGAGTNYKTYASVNKAKVLTLLGNTKYKGSGCSAGWYKVSYNGTAKYICSSNVNSYTSLSNAIVTNKNGVALRTSASSKSSTVVKLNYGQAITLYKLNKIKGKGCSSKWYKVSYRGKIRYVCSSNVTTTNNIYSVNSLSGIGVRDKAISKSSKTTTLKYMDQVALISTSKVKGSGCSAGWYKISINKKTGYVCSKYVSSSKNATYTNANINIRESASSKANSLVKIPKQKLVILQTTTKYSSTGCSSKWYKVNINGKTGYICSRYTELGKSAVANNTTTTPTTTSSPANVTSHKTSSGYYYTKKSWTYRLKENYGYVRTSASASSSLQNIVYLGTEFEVLDTKSKTSGCSAGWYKVKYWNKKVGYICKSLVEKYSDVTKTNSSYCNTLKNAGFPESYCPYLSYLHSKHPSWIFKAEKTNVTFLAAVNGESERNYTQITTAARSYLQSTTIREAGGWRTASDAYVAYMVDPRNYLNEENIFAFENLSYDSKYHTKNVVKSIFSGTYLDSDTYAGYFMSAANTYNVSPVHLASRVKQEGGTNSSYTAVSGKVSGTCTRTGYICSSYVNTNTKKVTSSSGYVKFREGPGTNYDTLTKAKNGESFSFVSTKKYTSEKGCADGWYKITLTKSLTGIYNYYNIGAYNDNPVMRGVKVAAGCLDINPGTPWDTREKAITNGASFIANGYINSGQDTMYYQKFNTGPNSLYSKYTHQYMTNILAPASESLSTYNSYSNLGLLNKAYVFKIPVYNSMPTYPTTHPPVK